MATLLLEIPQSARTLLKREAFENTILQFAQYVRWLKSNKCSCQKDDIGRPDPNCQYCSGKGFYYTFPSDLRIYNEQAYVSGDRELTVDYSTIKEILSVRRKINGNWYSLDVDSFSGTKININECEDFRKYYPFYVDYIFDPYIEFETTGTYQGEGNILVSNIETILNRGGTVIPDIISVESVKSGSQSYTVNSFSRNIVNIEYSGLNIPSTLTVKGKYINSWLFGVMNIQTKQRYESAYVAQDGDANIVVPNFITAGERDVFTLTMAEDTRMEILGRGAGDKDELPSFDVSRIVKIIEITATGIKVYEQYKDYILWERNKIKWLTDNQPVKLYSVEYLYHPSFVVIPQVPSIRYPQNDRFPRKLVVKYLDKSTKDNYEVVQ